MQSTTMKRSVLQDVNFSINQEAVVETINNFKQSKVFCLD